ncbi:MAG TPA: glycosyltransferase [Abditibacterium sp.]|jgi:glycosyltransferase involved in cell wall biosynthesis
MRDLIFLSLENWDEIWRRNQFVCAELARRFPDRRILFVGKSLFLPDLARHAGSRPGRQAVKQALSRRFWQVPDFPNISVFNPVKTLPNPLPGARKFNEKTITAQIQRAAQRAGIRDPLLWINPYDSGFLMGQLGERGVIYDITDDWELMSDTPAVCQRIAAQDRELCRRADLTVVCSQALYESRKAVTKQLLLLPNGVDAAHYLQIDALDQRPPGFFDTKGVFHPADSDGAAPNSESWPRPVFGYTGSLHQERVDLKLVVQLAQAHPHGSVVLVGPHHWTNDALAEALKNQPNLCAPGPVPYARIPEAMARFDVCIVPHCRSEFMESLNPIKLWEYLAAGKPIVSTDVAGFRDFPTLVRLSHDTPGFIGACREALEEVNQGQTAPLRAARRAEAAQHSWTSRVDTLLSVWKKLSLIEEAADEGQLIKGIADNISVQKGHPA